MGRLRRAMQSCCSPVALDVQPPLRATARFGLVSLGGRHEAPALHPVRELLAVWARDLAAQGLTAP